MSGRRFVVDELAGGFAVVEKATGELVAYATELRAFRLARFLNALDPSTDQIAVLLGDNTGANLLRTITLRHPGVCCRCGAELPAGTQARWHSSTQLMRHVRRCPRSAGAASHTRSVA